MIRLNDRGPHVRRWRGVMAARFGGYARKLGPLPLDTDVYGPRAESWQREYETRTGQLVDGIVSDADLLALGVVNEPPKPVVKPVLFTVEGHNSDMFVGPCAFTAKALEDEGVCRWQPIGYNNTALPFDNQSGIDELARLVGSTVLDNGTPFPPGTPWGMNIFSQGGIVGSRFFLEHVRPTNGRLHWRLKDFRGCLAFGNPYRENGVIAEWVPDPPRPNTQGISDVRMTFTPPNWKEVSRHGDLYAENEVSNSGEHKTAIYKAVQNQWTGTDSIVQQLVEIGLNPAPELIAVATAIVSGVRFLFDMGRHGTYDLAPCVDFMRARLTA